jgi:hypothetical protein
MFNSILNIKSGKQMQQTNPLSPNRMTPEQRVHEVANIIAQGIIRLRAPHSNKTQLLDSDSNVSLAMSAYRSVHGETENANTSEEK